MHPVGPRSSRIYWVRRAMVAALAVVALTGIGYLITVRARHTTPVADQSTLPAESSAPALTGVLAGPSADGSGSSAAASPSAASPASSSTAATPSAVVSPSPSAVASTQTSATAGTGSAGVPKTTAKTTGAASGRPTPAASTGRSASKPAATSSGKPTPAPTTSAARTPTATTPTSTKPTATKPSTTTPTSTTPTSTTPTLAHDAQGRLLCPDSWIGLQATTGAPAYPTGSQPILGLTVTNIGQQTCVRDLSGPLQVFTVLTGGGQRIWSTADCFPGEGADVRELDPGESLQYNIRWSGTTSTPGCQTARTQVPAGSYVVDVDLGKLAAKPAVLTITD